MARHIVARTSDIPPGGNKVFGVDGRDIVVFHVNGEFFALLNRCPHEGAPLEKAACVARLTSPEPGIYQRSRVGELLRCPWHGWEFDMRNGQSYFDPKRVKVRSYPVAVESGEELQKGPYVAETFPVHVEDSYVIIEPHVMVCRVGKGALAPCPPSRAPLVMVGTLRFAHPTTALRSSDDPPMHDQPQTWTGCCRQPWLVCTRRCTT